MKQQNKINEMVPGDNLSTSVSTSTPASSSGANNASINIKKKDLNDPSVTRNLSKLGKVNVNVIEEIDNLIEPQDKATIKYLSNIKDVQTNKVSQPFTIKDKRYQMIRGIRPSKEIVMAVFCHDDINEAGENVIHEIEDFEKNIVKPVMEEEAMMGDDMEIEAKVDVEPKMETKKVDIEKGSDSLNLSEFKHYLVNEKSGKFRKFKSIVELAAAVMGEDEKYMPIKEFRKFFEGKVFGGKKEAEMNLNEIAPTGEESDEEMNAKAKKLMEIIKKRIPSTIITTIKTPVAKREVIAAFAEMIGVPRQGLPNLIAGLKDMSKVKPTTQAQQAQQIEPTQPATQLAPAGVAERKVMTKSELTESLSQPNVIKTIKVKDIK